MKNAVFAVSLFLLHSSSLHGAVNPSCKAGAPDASLVRVHGRLNVYDGGYPNLRLWQIGSKHLFGIYSDPADFLCGRGTACEDDGDPKLPGDLIHLNLLESTVYGDFEIRLLEPLKPGHMQAACIVEAEHLVIQR
ncbi:MAG TPA: hypothetical protein VHX60_11455 [Acidobacteriaceae bacterium]|jgi:hypothetical protein|nr:hypothetical protein [Acidobacteriaceae bacterium]